MSRRGETAIPNAALDDLAGTLTRTVAEAAKAWTASEDPGALGSLFEAVLALRTVEEMGGEAPR